MTKQKKSSDGIKQIHLLRLFALFMCFLYQHYALVVLPKSYNTLNQPCLSLSHFHKKVNLEDREMVSMSNEYFLMKTKNQGLSPSLLIWFTNTRNEI